MIDINNIHEQWLKDCEIDSLKLDESSRNTPLLHAKYLRILSEAKLSLKHAEFDQRKMLKDKWLYYSGKMCQQDIESRNWDPDPFDGLKVLKGDYEHYYNSDPDIIESEAKIEYLTNVIDVLNEIINNLKWRHQTIRNIIAWRQFESGN